MKNILSKAKRYLPLIFISIPIFTIAQQDPTLKNYYTEVRKAFNEKNAYETVAFVEKRWRIAGNKGFDESIFFVENILKKAGYVNETSAKPTDKLPFRIEKRPMKR